MSAPQPTVLATSGGWRWGPRGRDWAPLAHHAVALARVPEGRRPRVCVLGTAMGDQLSATADVYAAGHRAGFETSVLDLFPMPSVDDVAAHLLAQDVVWVDGGSVVNLLAVWRAHQLEGPLREAWQAGVVLAGVSAGSICWYQGGPTDSYGPTLRPVTDALGFLPYGNGVHYDNEAQRRPLLHGMVGDGTLGESHCTDDGVGMVYHGSELVEAVAETPGKGAYVVRRDDSGDGVTETRIEPRLLPGSR
ncbi:peptidase E [Kineococcus rubinsiae]|uniref:Type 1 glutamine amidotransferase-like domain-containing protein n=1 Tax=Kineococcus rubinsiae TaxID=2609562 RepID=UPI001431C31D|nr:peptidase E [Kineococcus rubinsiae]NIZ92654.1 peptidase E [Kineococcus rubinsiae]